MKPITLPGETYALDPNRLWLFAGNGSSEEDSSEDDDDEEDDGEEEDEVDSSGKKKDGSSDGKKDGKSGDKGKDPKEGKLYTKAELDAITENAVKTRLERERRVAARQKAEKDGDKDTLLAELQKEIDEEYKPAVAKVEKLEAENTALREVVDKQIKAILKDLPQDLQDLDLGEDADPVKRLSWLLTKVAPKAKKLAEQNGNQGNNGKGNANQGNNGQRKRPGNGQNPDPANLQGKDPDKRVTPVFNRRRF